VRDVIPIKIEPNELYRMELSDLAPGVFNLRILDQKDNLTKRFIRIQ
jgi:hypothetical protein